MKREAIGHTKLKRLCRYLKVRQYVAIGILESLWHMTALESPQGNIGKLSNEDIAFGIDWQESEDDLIKALVQSKWLDEHPEHRLVVHDWHEHCDDYVDMKVARSTLFYANGVKARMSRLSVAERAKIEENYALENSQKPESVLPSAVQRITTVLPSAVQRITKISTVTQQTDLPTLCAQNGDPCAQSGDPCAQHAENSLAVRTTMPSLAMPSQAKPSLASPSLTAPDEARRAATAEPEHGESAILKSSKNGKAHEPTEPELDAFSIWAHAVYQRHPKQKNLHDTLWTLKQKFANRPDDQKLLDENHPLWIAYWQLDPSYPRFVPGLADRDGRGWLNDQVWRKPPPPPPVADTKHARAKAWANQFKGETQ